MSQNNGSLDYGLDPVGNRTSDTSSLTGIPSGSWSYNADDELSSETYDQDGNVTAADGKTFSYDSQNELVTMNGTAVQMLYDGDGNRVAKAVTSGGVTTTTYYLVDDLNPTGLPQVMDELTNGVVTRTYTYGLQRISEDQVINGAWTPSFYSYDGMGSVRQLTNSAGAVTDSYEYDAFGNEITHTGTTPNNYLYRGEHWDPDLELYYLRARYMNPFTGRFVSRDSTNSIPTDVHTLHRYLYAGGDPVNRIDPSGHEDLEEQGLAEGEISVEEKAVQKTAEEINCSYSQIGAALFGTLVHQYFLNVLVTQTGTAPGDWIMKTLPGQTGVDATYTGAKEIGYTYAELKPVNYSPQATGCQIGKWGLPQGETSIWWYNKFGLIGQTFGFW